MPLQIIQGQAINFNPPAYDSCRGEAEEVYCALFNSGDPVRVQFKQTPCGNGLISDPEFKNTGAQLFANPSFQNNYHPFTAVIPGLSRPFIPFDYDEINQKICYNSPSGAAHYLTQYLSLAPSVLYAFNVVLTLTAGTVRSFILDAVTGYNLGGTISSTGTHVLTQTSGSNAIAAGLWVSDDFEGCIEFLGCGDASFTSQITGVTGQFSIGLGSICHSPNLSTSTVTWDLSTVFPTVGNEFYQLTIRQRGRTSGSLTVNLAGQSWVVTDKILNTFYTDPYFSRTGNDLVITASADYDGCIEFLQVHQLRNDYDFIVMDEDGNEIYRDAALLAYENEYIELIALPISSLLPEGLEGCYKFAIVDPCDPNYFSPELINNPNFSQANQWTTNPGECVSFSEGVALYDDPGGSNSAIIYPPAGLDNPFPFDCDYVIEVKIGRIFNGDGSNVQIDFDFCGLMASFTSITENSTISQLVSIGGSSGPPQILIDAFSTTKFEILGISIKTVDGCENNILLANYVSNCINVKESHECTKLITAVCDDKYNLGFKWDFGNDRSLPLYYNFVLQQRLSVERFNPRYPIRGDKQIDSSGKVSLKYAVRSKYYELAVSQAIGETEHDCLSTQIICPDFKVDGVSFSPRLKELEPAWEKNGKNTIAATILELEPIELNLTYRPQL